MRAWRSSEVSLDKRGQPPRIAPRFGGTKQQQCGEPATLQYQEVEANVDIVSGNLPTFLARVAVQAAESGGQE